MEKDTTIKHLVLSGGGLVGFISYSILRESNKSGIWKLEKLESIYGTSAGAIISVIIALKYDWTEIDDYIIKRPWEKVFNIDIERILRSFDARGIFGKKIIEEIICPLLKGKDLEPTLTMKELYEYSNIDIHMFSTEIYKYETIDISHKTHPNWTVIDAIYCSSCLPIMFIPHLLDGNCYSDGGIKNNYPIYYCLENGANQDEIFGITFPKNYEKTKEITENSSLFDFLFLLLHKMRERPDLSFKNNTSYKIKYEIEVQNAFEIIYDFVNVLSSQEERIKLFDKGIEIWYNYISNINQETPIK